jgi:hypothetical protein
VGASSVLGDQIWVLVVSDSRPVGLEAKIWKLCGIPLEGPVENFASYHYIGNSFMEK